MSTRLVSLLATILLAGCATTTPTPRSAVSRTPSSVCAPGSSRCFLAPGESVTVGRTAVFCGVAPGGGLSPDEKCWDSCINNDHLGSQNCKNTCGLESPVSVEKCWNACLTVERLGSQNCKNICSLNFPEGVEHCWDACLQTDRLGSSNCKNICGITNRVARDKCWNACTNDEHLGTQNCKNICGL